MTDFHLFSVDVARIKVFDGRALKWPKTDDPAAVTTAPTQLLSSIHEKRFFTITHSKLGDYI